MLFCILNCSGNYKHLLSTSTVVVFFYWYLTVIDTKLHLLHLFLRQNTQANVILSSSCNS